MSIRIKDLAKIAGVSPATVSLALNGSELVNEVTRERILEMARDHGYTPNTYARRLALRRSGMLGLVIPDIENVFYASLVRETNRYAQLAGYGLSIAISDNSPALEEKIVTEMISSRVEGVVCVPVNVPDGSSGRFVRLLDAEIPAVCSTTRLGGDAAIPSVMCGLREGMRELAGYLFSRGCKKPVLLTGPAGVYTLDIRREGFFDAINESGIDLRDAEVIALDEVTYAPACAAAENLIKRVGEFDAVLCVNDMMALGVVNTFNRHGLAVPRDIAVAGFDDVVFAEASPAPLTTVRQDIAGIARESVALLLKLIGGLSPEQLSDIVLPAQLVIRQSTK
jgi:Transcriptional regulators